MEYKLLNNRIIDKIAITYFRLPFLNDTKFKNSVKR